MFKLKNILGAKNNVPEIVNIKVGYGSPILEGCIYFIANGSISIERPEKPVRFLAMETLEEGHTKEKVRGFVVTDGMIFEANADSSISIANIGDPLSFARDERGNITGVCTLDNGDGNSEGILFSRSSGKVDVLLY